MRVCSSLFSACVCVFLNSGSGARTADNSKGDECVVISDSDDEPDEDPGEAEQGDSREQEEEDAGEEEEVEEEEDEEEEDDREEEEDEEERGPSAGQC